MSLEDARYKIEKWGNDYNEYITYTGLTNMKPPEFASNAKE